MRSFLKNLLTFSISALIVLGIAYLVINIMMVKAVVKGNSMSPLLEDGDQLMCNKLTYNFNPPERYDIAMIELKDGQRIVKRVIGLPGESLKVNSFGRIEVNGHELDDPRGNGVLVGAQAGNLRKGVQLGMEEFFVMGDNKKESIDSRHDEVGIIKRSQFLGKVSFRFMPFKKFGTVE